MGNTRKAVILQGGGPTAVINSTLVASVLGFRTAGFEVYGSKRGFHGIIENEFYKLHEIPVSKLEKVSTMPGAALKSTRDKPTEKDCERIFERLEKKDIRYFYYIGGDDTARATKIISKFAEQCNYELHAFHLPKTIDNDLLENDHTPGFGSAAKFVAEATIGTSNDNCSLEGVYIQVTMGRNAGFIAASSSLAYNSSDGEYHLVYVPEKEFIPANFCKDVEDTFGRYGMVHITVSEGIWVKGKKGEKIPLVQVAAGKAGVELDREKFNGDISLSGNGFLADYLVQLVKQIGGKVAKRVRGDTLGYLIRSFPGIVSEVDYNEAWKVGTDAVIYTLSGDFKTGSIVIKREGNGKDYAISTSIVGLGEICRGTRKMPDNFINDAGNGITKEFYRYAKPLVGKLKEIATLE